MDKRKVSGIVLGAIILAPIGLSLLALLIVSIWSLIFLMVG